MTTKEKELIDKEGIYSISKEVFPFLIGVYFLFYNNEIVYVGKTTNGLSRVYSHIKTKKFNRYSFILCDISKLNSTEEQYIIKYRPKYNKTLQDNISIATIKRILKNSQLVHHKNIIKEVINKLEIKYTYIEDKAYISKIDLENIIQYIRINYEMV